jgi:hypothetical protein
VDSLDQSAQAGPSIWRDRAQAHLCLQDLPPGVIAMGRHDGYRRLDDPVTHERSVAYCEPGVYVVIDRLYGANAHQVALHWHALPATGVTCLGEGRFTLAHGVTRITMLHWSDRDLRPRLARGELNPRLGWYSAGYGQCEPAPVLCFEGTARLPLASVTVIDLSAENPVVDLQVESCRDGTPRLHLRRALDETVLAIPARGSH